jgi:hypothetical protein
LIEEELDQDLSPSAYLNFKGAEKNLGLDRFDKIKSPFNQLEMYD